MVPLYGSSKTYAGLFPKSLGIDGVLSDTLLKDGRSRNEAGKSGKDKEDGGFNHDW